MAEPLFEILGEQQSQLTVIRHQRARQAYREAMAGLARAKQSGFQPKSSLLDVSAQLNLALRLNRQDPLNHLGMAYFLMLLDDLPKAESYAQRALALDSTSAKAQRMLQGIAQLKQRQRLAKGQSPMVLTQATSLTYRETQVVILQEVKRVLEEIPAPPAALPPAIMSDLTQHHQQLEALHILLNSKIQKLAIDHDITDLKLLLKPLLRFIQRFKTALAACQEIQQLSLELEATFGRSADLFMTLAGPVTDAFSLELEAIFDRCDSLAERLDALEKQQIEIRELETEYGNLIAYIGVLKEQWEIKRQET